MLRITNGTVYVNFELWSGIRTHFAAVVVCPPLNRFSAYLQRERERGKSRKITQKKLWLFELLIRLDLFSARLRNKYATRLIPLGPIQLGATSIALHLCMAPFPRKTLQSLSKRIGPKKNLLAEKRNHQEAERGFSCHVSSCLFVAKECQRRK
jgi:hypothetical protein